MMPLFVQVKNRNYKLNPSGTSTLTLMLRPML